MNLTKRPGFAAEVDSSETFISVDNSSTTAINTGSNFTGTWEDVGKFSSVVVAVTTDQTGYYEVQFSPDGTNVDSTLTRYYRTDIINPPHRFTITRRYCRIVFYNDSGTNQTYFRLQTMFGSKASLNIPLGGTVALDYDAFVVRPTDYQEEVSLGKRQGATRWNKWGYNDDIDTASSEMVWSPGGNMTFLTSAETLDLVSTSTDDDSGGTGANLVQVVGIDANRRYQVELVTMDGTTDVTTTNTWLGVNRIAVALAGSAGENVGTITATASTAATTQAEIPASGGVTQQCIFFTQEGHKAIIKNLYLNVRKLSGGGGSPRVTAKIITHSFVSNCKYELFRIQLDTDVENTLPDLPLSLPIGEKEVVYVDLTTNTNNTAVTARLAINEHRDVDTV